MNDVTKDLLKILDEERNTILEEIITKHLKGNCGLLTPQENRCAKLIVRRIETDIRARCGKL